MADGFVAYTWKDDAGVVHNSPDPPPAGVAFKRFVYNAVGQLVVVVPRSGSDGAAQQAANEAAIKTAQEECEKGACADNKAAEKAAGDEVKEAEKNLEDASKEVADAQKEVNESFESLNTAIKTQKVVAVGSSVGTFILSKVTPYGLAITVIGSSVNIANGFLSPDAGRNLAALDNAYRNTTVVATDVLRQSEIVTIAERAERLAHVLDKGNVALDVYEFLDKPELYEVLSDLDVDSLVKFKDAFDKLKLSGAEKILGPSRKTIDGQLDKLIEARKKEDAAQKDLLEKRAALNRLYFNDRGREGAWISHRVFELTH
jgi:hypothetical protein